MAQATKLGKSIDKVRWKKFLHIYFGKKFKNETLPVFRRESGTCLVTGEDEQTKDIHKEDSISFPSIKQKEPEESLNWAVNYSIAEYLYRKGETVVGDIFCKESEYILEGNQLKDKFTSLFEITSQLKYGETTNALR